MKCLKPIFLSALTLITLNMPTVAQAADANAPVYNPPKRGAPAGRVGGGTRGDRTAFTLSVLAPDHTGLTTSEQPSLYWYISNPTSLPIEFTLMNPAEVKPILETKIAPPAKPGIQRIRLADYKIRLAPNTPYRWFVAVVPDADRRSKDILAGGAIERIEVPGDLKGKLASAGDLEGGAGTFLQEFDIKLIDTVTRHLALDPWAAEAGGAGNLCCTDRGAAAAITPQGRIGPKRSGKEGTD